MDDGVLPGDRLGDHSGVGHRADHPSDVGRSGVPFENGDHGAGLDQQPDDRPADQPVAAGHQDPRPGHLVQHRHTPVRTSAAGAACVSAGGPDFPLPRLSMGQPLLP